MILRFNKFICRLGSPIVYFIATTFLASVWASIGFQIWQKICWIYAAGIWILFLGPVILGYYLGGVLDKLHIELKLLVDKSLGFQPSIIEVEKIENEKLNGLLINNKKFKRLWLKFLIFFVLIIFDTLIAIWLYKTKKVI